jgi:hypothetical protein
MKNLKKGQWLFTCSLKPKQFSHYDDNDEDFNTIGGANHSFKHCGCKLISDEYAEWFINNITEDMLPPSGNEKRWEIYETKIKELCIRDNIEFEGF